MKGLIYILAFLVSLNGVSNDIGLEKIETEQEKVVDGVATTSIRPVELDVKGKIFNKAPYSPAHEYVFLVVKNTIPTELYLRHRRLTI
jgi:hypothetical protein